MRRVLLSSALMLALAVLGVSKARAENWERFRGPNGSGVAADKNIPVIFDDKANVIWTLALPGLGNSSPVIWGKNLFIQTAAPDGSQRSLLCIDVTTGHELWSRGIPGAKASIHAKNTLASATPATDGEAVYASFWDGKNIFLIAYDFKGDLLWNKPLGHFSSQHGAGASPILFRDKVIFYNDMDKDDFKTKKPVPHPAILYAFNKKTGDVVWQIEREAFRACYAAPFILEVAKTAPELIVTSTTSIVSYHPDDGTPNWTWNWKFKGMPLRTIGATIYQDGMLFARAGDGGGDRLMSAITLGGLGKAAHPKLAWTNAKDFPYVPCLLGRGDHLYFVNDLGFAGCYDAKTGKRTWFERLEGADFTASPVMIGNKIYAPSEEGEVYVFTATTAAYEPLAKNNLGEPLFATPAVADGRLYIRGRNHLFCIGTK